MGRNDRPTGVRRMRYVRCTHVHGSWYRLRGCARTLPRRGGDTEHRDRRRRCQILLRGPDDDARQRHPGAGAPRRHQRVQFRVRRGRGQLVMENRERFAAVRPARRKTNRKVVRSVDRHCREIR